MSQASYIFTVVAGRSGQATLTEILRRHVPGCFPAFEAPSPALRLPGRLGQLEHRFRRRFIETNELLGRGKVLDAFERGDIEYLETIARKRLRMIRRDLARSGAHIYFDVSKFFARGLHVGFCRALPKIGLLRLVRDPVANMRSFLNRSKNFRLDNSLPDAPSNILRLDSRDMAPGELYLWAWCEIYLRFDRMVEAGGVACSAEMRTELLDDPVHVEAALRNLGLDFTTVRPVGHLNTNIGQGFRETRIDVDAVATFERFMARLPGSVLDQISYLAGYNPGRSLTGNTNSNMLRPTA